MPTLPGEHLCAKHQGNTSVYAECNCTICKLQSLQNQIQAAFNRCEAAFKNRQHGGVATHALYLELSNIFESHGKT